MKAKDVLEPARGRKLLTTGGRRGGDSDSDLNWLPGGAELQDSGETQDNEA